VNRYLIDELQLRGLWTEEMRMRLKLSEGSVRDIEELPDDLKLLYRTVWEIPMRSLIDMATARNAYIDQSQSLNLFAESPNIGKLSSMYMYAWKKGLKTTYYLRSRPATKIAKTTVQNYTRPVAEPSQSIPTVAERLACSLESPETCEACQ
jgi:ribonucleoside-diphosphate reductase alpha chain